MQAQELLNYDNWVVVGDVLNSSKYAHRILNSLKEAGFNVEGVNPRDKTDIVVKSLGDVSYKIDVIDLCINPLTGLNIVKEAAELKIDKVLIQPGAESEDILDFCKSNGITAIEGCALVELSYYKRK
jgi:predicted CoA-binding protein